MGEISIILVGPECEANALIDLAQAYGFSKPPGKRKATRSYRGIGGKQFINQVQRCGKGFSKRPSDNVRSGIVEQAMVVHGERLRIAVRIAGEERFYLFNLETNHFLTNAGNRSHAHRLLPAYLQTHEIGKVAPAFVNKIEAIAYLDWDWTKEE